MRNKFILTVLTFGLLVLGISPAAAAPKAGIYQLDFSPISTTLGSSSLAQSEVSAMVTKLDNAYRAITGGRIGFALRSILPGVTTSTPISSVNDMSKLVNKPLPADAGFAGAIVIGYIPRDSTLPIAGQALGTQYILLNYPINSAFNTLMHELGHSFGLAHAGTAICTYGLSSQCKAIEYGDYSDFMGNYTYANPPSATVARTSAYNLDALGALSPDEVTTIDTSTEILLAPVYSTGGVRLAYLSLLGQLGYAIEYRPAVNDDLQLMATEVPVPGTNTYYPNQPSYGVQVRALAPLSSYFSAAMPTYTYSGFQDISIANGFSGKMSSLLENFDKGRQGMDPGQSVALFDGTVISVLTADAVRGAQVRITRPSPIIDTQFSSDALKTNWEFSGTGESYADSAKKEIILPRNFSAPLPQIHLQFELPKTAVRLVAAELVVNGQSVATLPAADLLYNNATNGTLPPSAAFSYAPPALGTFTIAVKVQDASGRWVSSQPQILKSGTKPLVSYTELCLQKKGWPESCSPYPIFQISFCDSVASDSIYLQDGKKLKLVKSITGVVKADACTDRKNPYFYNFVANYPSPTMSKAVYKTVGKGSKGKPDSVDFFTIVLKTGKR